MHEWKIFPCRTNRGSAIFRDILWCGSTDKRHSCAWERQCTIVRMPVRPLVSVLVLHYGSPEDTIRCLRSLVTDGYVEKDILVLDNGSPVPFPLESRIEFGDTVQWYESDYNRGYAGGNNFLAERASGDYLALVNNDAVVTPGWLGSLLSAFNDSQIAACQPKIRSLLYPQKFDYAGGSGGFLDQLGFPYVRGRVLQTIEDDHGQYDDPCDIHWTCGAAFVVRRDLFLEQRGFDELLFAYVEEVDLSWRLRRAGYRLRCIPSALVYHESGKALRDDLPRKLYLLHRNSLCMLVKNATLPGLFIVLPLRLILDLCACAYYACKGAWRGSLMPLKAFVDFLQLAPAFIKQRSRGGSAVTFGVPSIVMSYYLFGRRTWNAVENRAVRTQTTATR